MRQKEGFALELRIRQSDHAIVDEQGRRVRLKRYHPLDDKHVYMVKKIDNRTFEVRIKRGKKEVQRGRISTLSFVTERPASNTRSHVIRLHPQTPIWPITDLVDRLARCHIPFYMVSPLADNVLTECAMLHNYPHMISDGQVERTVVPATGDMSSMCLFTVKDASWAVYKIGSSEFGKVQHIYLWMDAANKSDEIIEVVQRQGIASPPSPPSTM